MGTGGDANLDVDDSPIPIEPQNINRETHILHPERMNILCLEKKQHGLILLELFPIHQAPGPFFLSHSEFRRDRKTVWKIDLDEPVFTGLSRAIKSQQSDGQDEYLIDRSSPQFLPLRPSPSPKTLNVLRLRERTAPGEVFFSENHSLRGG